jgi:tRNA(fMet)-specific endonuclease VapC
MSYLLDTNTCIGYLNRRNQNIFQHLTVLSPSEILLCDVVKFELYYGAYRSSRQQQNLARLERFFGEFQSLAFDGEAASICGLVRKQIESKGTPIGEPIPLTQKYELESASS